MPETFADLLAKCLPDGMSEEAWAIAHKIGVRTLRRAKGREVRLQRATLERLAAAMEPIGKDHEKRVAKIAAATEPVGSPLQ